MKGTFKPNNPAKYVGNSKNIVYRSSWELKLMLYLDSHQDVIEWASEEFSVPYISPLDNRIHRYFPDFWVKKKNKDGKISTVVIEVKPEKETKMPVRPLATKAKKPNKRFMNDVMKYTVNKSKWESAQKLCENNGWEFQIMTEKHLNIR